MRVIVLPVVTCVSGCGPGPGGVVGDGDAGASSTGTTDGLGMTESTGAPFDIGPWFGRSHYEPPFQPFGQLNEIYGSAVLGNFEIRSDLTAVASWDDCYGDKPLEEASYIIEPISSERVRLLPGDGETTLGYWAADVDTIELTRDAACGVLTFVLTGGPFETPVSEDFWHPGAACWVARCVNMTAGETTFQIDYCEGEQPPPCP